MVGHFTGDLSGWLQGGGLAVCLLSLQSSRETWAEAQSRLGGRQDVGVGSPLGDHTCWAWRRQGCGWGRTPPAEHFLGPDNALSSKEAPG